jgi:predicted nuclease of predicted toxin-antitoxin system
MNFLIDANLSRRLVDIFNERGHQVVHTLDLLDGNITTDLAILQYADEQNCIIVTKDSDFAASFWLKNRPDKLLLFSIGNINNRELEALLISNFDQIISDLTNNRFIELTREHVIVHA